MTDIYAENRYVLHADAQLERQFQNPGQAFPPEYWASLVQLKVNRGWDPEDLASYAAKYVPGQTRVIWYFLKRRGKLRLLKTYASSVEQAMSRFYKIGDFTEAVFENAPIIQEREAPLGPAGWP